jgi:hypothetical protein
MATHCICNFREIQEREAKKEEVFLHKLGLHEQLVKGQTVSPTHPILTLTCPAICLSYPRENYYPTTTR